MKLERFVIGSELYGTFFLIEDSRLRYSFSKRILFSFLLSNNKNYVYR